MPVPVRLGDRTAVVDMTDGSGTLQVPAGVEPVIDSGELDPAGHAGTGIVRVGAPDCAGLSQPVVLAPSCRR